MRSGAFAILLLAAPALAQVKPTDPPTAGIYNPTLGVAGDTDASAVEKNPSLMGWLRSWEAVYFHTETATDGRVGGRGDALFAATPLPWIFHMISVGAGFQSIRPPDVYPYGEEEKFSLALSWHIVPALSVGLSYAHLWSQHPPLTAGIDTMDLSLAFRLGRWAAGGLVIHDLTAPTIEGLPVQRVYEPEVSFRPFGTPVIELAAGARFGERRGDVDPRFRLWINPARGVWLKTDVQWTPSLSNDVRVAIGLQLDLEHFGAGAYYLFGRENDRVGSTGVTVAARISGDRWPAFWTGPTHFEKVELGPGVVSRQLAGTLAHLRRLERDRAVAGIVVILGDLDGGWASADELRSALLRLRHAKKRVFVYLADTTTRGYYVATAGERIYLDPAGGLRLTGMASTVLFYKGFGDLIGVRGDFVRIAEYKSAPESYTRTGSSEPAREQREQLVDDTYRSVVDGIAASRHVAADRVRQWIDRGPFTAKEALDLGLVDELKAGDEVEDAIADRLHRHVALHDPPRSPEKIASWSEPAIAVLFVEGDIIDGKSYKIPLLDMTFVGMRSLVPAIERARDDARVKAIVVRVDSPGGSALASDLIARELERAKQVKPVVCSFGDLAASGGYFLAAPCQKIFAAPTTVTGSIGIFTGKFDVSGLATKLGVSVERYERGARASLESMWRPYTDDERTAILEKLRYYYNRFVDTVARGRGLTAAQVDAIGRGHVWSGRAAQARGLVDAFGGLADAIAEAKELAGLKPDEPIEIQAIPEETTLLGTVLGWLGIDLRAADKPMLAIAPGLVDLLRSLPGSLLVAPGTAQARLDGQFLQR
jgi:protease-4